MTYRDMTNLGRFLAAAAALALLLGFSAWTAPAHAEFGIEPGSLRYDVLDASGNVIASPQAGEHPFATQVSFAFNLRPDPYSEPFVPGPIPDGEPRDIVTQLPAGFVGNPRATAQCDIADLSLSLVGCPTASQVGIVTAVLGRNLGDAIPYTFPLYNVKPPTGMVARLGFFGLVAPVVMDIGLRTGQDYGITATIHNLTEASNVLSTTLTLWGVPGDRRHDAQRYLAGAYVPGMAGGAPLPSPVPPAPYLTNPSDCGTATRLRVEVSSWQDPENRLIPYDSPDTTYSGCEKLQLPASIQAQPGDSRPGVPAGLGFDLHVQQAPEEAVLATPPLRDTAVTLPEGMTVNPSSAHGLEGCTPMQIGLNTEASPACPEASKLGTAEVDTPLLAHPLKGFAYLAQPGANPFGSLLAMYLAAEGEGVLIKLAGHIEPDPSTGRLTVAFEDTPELPFEDLHLDLFEGPRAPLAMPDTCGPKTVTSQLTAWSGQTVQANSTFTLSADGHGAPCASQFAPSLTAGATNAGAGGSSSFVLQVQRSDSDSQLRTISATLPPGLLAHVGSVPLCTSAQASAGACPAASRIGKAVVGVGAGSEPFYVENGKVFLTEGYRGAPFGLDIVVPAVAGPFDLGDVNVRAALRVNPTTAQVTAESDPLPSILDGISLRIRDVRVIVARPGFMVNPTSCAPTSIATSIGSYDSTSANPSAPFQVEGCAKLRFAPKLAASTSSKTSRANGARLHVAIKAGPGQANIKSVHVVLPKALPARLPSLNHACSEAQFAADPAGCPAGSIVGTATAHTPVLPVPLSGPAIFVSHGGAAFPDLDLVLQGDGVTVILTGNTFISASGVTSSTFASVPDVPIGRFDLVLPQGPHSVFGANGDLCARSPVMPTTITGQNGAQVTQRTKISVSGCKRSIAVAGHSVKGTHASIRVKVPSAGTLVAAGKGIRRSVARTARAGIVTIGVTLSSRDLRILSKNPSQHVNVKVGLRFKPANGSPLTTEVKLLMG